MVIISGKRMAGYIYHGASTGRMHLFLVLSEQMAGSVMSSLSAGKKEMILR